MATARPCGSPTATPPSRGTGLPIRPAWRISRGRAMMDGHRPAVWLSDRYTAQQGHGAAHQTCLAHLAREVAYAVEVSADPVPWRLQLWLNAVFALAERVSDLAAATLSAKRRALDQQLAAILCARSSCDVTRALQAKISRAREQL